MKFVGSLIPAVTATLLTLGAGACAPGRSVADAIGPVSRIRIDTMPDEGDGRQFFISDPKAVADMLQAIGTAQSLRSGARFAENEFPSLGLTFFDAQGKPHATLNFSGPIGPRNELYELAFSANYLGSVVPADPGAMNKLIEQSAPADEANK